MPKTEHQTAMEIAQQALRAQEEPIRIAREKIRKVQEENDTKKRKRIELAGKKLLAKTDIETWFPDVTWTLYEYDVNSGVYVWDTGTVPSGQGSNDWIRLAVDEKKTVRFVTFPNEHKGNNKWAGTIVNSSADVARAVNAYRDSCRWPDSANYAD